MVDGWLDGWKCGELGRICGGKADVVIIQEKICTRPDYASELGAIKGNQRQYSGDNYGSQRSQKKQWTYIQSGQHRHDCGQV